MTALKVLPSMLVFGPQSDLPAEDALEDLRQELISNKCLAPLKQAVADLGRFWETLVGSDHQSLGQVPGAAFVEALSHWATNGGIFPHHHQHQVPNLYYFPVSLLLQICQYTRYLALLGTDSHSDVLGRVQDGGIQGFCVGFLAAVAVASADSAADIGSAAAIALRLAVCIAAYADYDNTFSGDVFEASCVAVRWRQDNAEEKAKLGGIIQAYQDAYISSFNDKACATVTLRASDLDSFVATVRQSNLRAKAVSVHGRFHYAGHGYAVEKLLKLVARTQELQLPPTEKLNAPVRSTVDGAIITTGSLTHHVLENTLLKPADWYATMMSSLSTVQSSEKIIVMAGFGNHIPSSLVQEQLFQVFPLSKLSGKSYDIPIAESPTRLLANTSNESSQYPSHAIAIVGMAGRFPGADSLDELWDIVLSGKSMAEAAPVERLKLSQTGDYANTKWWGNFLRDPHAFDSRFFKKSSREALAWDPQQRILLEVMYEALESGGYFGASSKVEPKDYGCYIGACMNNYYDNMSCHAPTAYATIGTSRCFISGCMSHYFGWTGPSLTIDTACSSSLVAINTACRAIWSGECSRAVAGGTNVISSPFDYQNLSAAGFLSPSGQCKPFDIGADGYCRGEGVGVVVLKSVAEAIKDNDTIHGIILGTAANQNHNDSHVTVPHSESQVDLYQKVMKLGHVNPESISYVEAHGTGTGVGDPVEVRSIRDAFGGPQRDSVLHFGSIKGNIGHTEATAGVAGLIKVLLMMKHNKIPAQASHNSVNPKIPDFSKHQMAIPRTIVPWNSPLRMACVNSYGAAGSNSALLVCEKPALESTDTLVPASKYPLVITAGSTNSLGMYSKKLLSWLDQAVEANTPNLLASLTFNLADRANHALPHVLTKTVSNISDVRSALEASISGSAVSGIPQNPGPAVFVFGGQESDHIGLSAEVYRSAKVFRHHLDLCNDLLESQGLESLYPAIFQTEPIKDLVTLHSALFAVQFASAKAWMDCGLKVDAVVGHSFGQLTAFCISGALSLPDAMKLVVGRASLMIKKWGPEPGSMLFIQADRQTVEGILQSMQPRPEDHYVEIACYNGPRSHVVVGSSSTIDSLERHVAKTPSLRDFIRTKRLKVTHGFHSKFTEPVLPDLAAIAGQLTWSSPIIPLETCDEFGSVSGPDSSIVPNHTRQPVFFQSAIERLAERFPGCSWIEAGRGSSVLQLVKGCIPESKGHTFLSPLPTASPNAIGSLADATIELWRSGFQVQYWPFHRSQKPEYEHCSLPTYQFERSQHWLPFTGRGLEKEVEEPKPVQETHDILSFLRFKDASENEAVFRVDPLADRFEAMLSGHVMAGQALAPASLYFELAARAALFLKGDTEAKTYVPTVDNLLMNSPICRDTTLEILLTLKRVGDNICPRWSFSMTTQATVGPIAAPFEQSTGQICLKPRDHAQTAHDFKRFESLTGYRRYDELLNHPDAERMQGSHIYRAFNTVVHYGEAFRGIKQVACVGMEAAGKVVITPPADDPADQRLCHTPMTDSFMQFAGFLVNYFNNPSMEDVFVCMNIEHIEIGGDFDPDAKEWIVYSNMTEGGDADASSDAYVFEAASKKMVMAAFGFRFSKMSQALLGRLLKSVNKSGDVSNARLTSGGHRSDDTTAAFDTNASTVPVRNSGSSHNSSRRPQLLQVLSNVTDVPVDEITDDSTLEDLGVDSLMATEVINDIRSVLGLTIDLTSFLFFPNIGALAAHVDEKLGVTNGREDNSDTDSDSDVDTLLSLSDDSGIADVDDPVFTKMAVKELEKPPIQILESLKPAQLPTIASACDAFQEMRRGGYDKLAEGTKALGFWTDAYPHQARLVLAYVVEAFAQLGCDVKKIHSGDRVPQVVGTLARHKQLVGQFYRILEDGKLICSTANQGFTRTTVPVDPTAAESIFSEIINLYPQHAVVNRLVRAVGSQLAACLVGEIDALQIVFGNKENKKSLEDMYEFWPLLRTPTLLLGDFLIKALTNANGGGKFRILEVGAGTGGTTRYIVNLLRTHGVPFEYVYSDVSSSLVAAARKQFKGAEDMSFELLDIAKPPKAEYLEAFHCIIATNCIHATQNLGVSLLHLRKMLREDGALTLVEITQNMFWLDIVVGLFEGWWLFEDGRTHALVNEKHWERQMKEAGFKEVSWTDGASPESGTVRVIGAFPSASPRSSPKTAPGPTQVKAAMETVVYKQVGDLDIHADVYYPVDDGDLPSKKMPIALMIHGGSHIIFSRKDIRPAQTRHLLGMGFLPVSLDHRLCPEVSLAEGPMVDVCDALSWARNTLPHLPLKRRGLQIDGERVVVVGWSSGGQLAMSLAWTAPQRGLRPPEAVLAFYCPTNYEDEWWRHPIQPIGAEDKGQQYDVLEAIGDKPISNYGVVGAWEPLSDPRIMTDPRCRIVLHINWKAQTLPVIIGGLLSKAKAASLGDEKDWNALPQPTVEQIRAASPRAQIAGGNYNTPTFLIHGTADELIPWQQSQGTYKAMADRGIASDLVLVEGAPHICDLSSDPESEGWKAALRGYEFISSFVF